MRKRSWERQDLGQNQVLDGPTMGRRWQRRSAGGVGGTSSKKVNGVGVTERKLGTKI